MDFLRDRRVDEWEEENGPDNPKPPGRVGVIHPPCLVIPRQVASPQSLLPLHQAKTNIQHHFRSVKTKHEKSAYRRVRLHRPFLAEEALARKTSLSWPVDSAPSRASQ